MAIKTELFIKNQLKNNLPEIRPGDTVKVYQKFKDKNKEKTQVFEGLVIARKHGKGISSTITVRKVISGIGVEKIFPIHSPLIEKIEIVKRAKVRRARLYYLRTAKGRKARLKRKEFKEAIAEVEEEKTKEENLEERKDVDAVKSEEKKEGGLEQTAAPEKENKIEAEKPEKKEQEREKNKNQEQGE